MHGDSLRGARAGGLGSDAFRRLQAPGGGPRVPRVTWAPPPPPVPISHASSLRHCRSRRWPPAGEGAGAARGLLARGADFPLLSAATRPASLRHARPQCFLCQPECPFWSPSQVTTRAVPSCKVPLDSVTNTSICTGKRRVACHRSQIVSSGSGADGPSPARTEGAGHGSPHRLEPGACVTRRSEVSALMSREFLPLQLKKWLHM